MIRTSLKLVTAATANLISTADAKTHLQVDFADATQNTYIDSLCLTAQQIVENYCNLKLTASTWDFYLTDFPARGIVLPFSPIASITSIKYYDSTNTLQTVSTSDYWYSIYENPCKIEAETWPGVYDDRTDAVQVRFVTGYTSPDACPDALKTAILLLLRDLYDNKGNQVKERMETWQVIAYPYRVFHSTMDNTR